MAQSATKVPRTAAKARHAALGLSLDDVKGMYRKMLECRLLGERMMQLNRMGRAAFVGVADGHEGAEVGSAWCIRRGHDWVHPYYRDVGVALVLGQSMKAQFLGVFARATAPNSGGRQIVNQFSDVEAKIVTGSVCIATQFPQAAGIALAYRMRGEDGGLHAREAARRGGSGLALAQPRGWRTRGRPQRVPHVASRRFASRSHPRTTPFGTGSSAGKTALRMMATIGIVSQDAALTV